MKKLLCSGVAMAIALNSSHVMGQTEEQSLIDRIEKLEAELQTLKQLASVDEEQTVVETNAPVQSVNSAPLIDPYGFLRLDMNYDSSAPNNNQVPMFVPSPDTQPSDSSLTIYPRMTRLGANFNASDIEVLGASLTGKVELDFHGGGSESRNLLRMRKAYMNLAWEDFELLLGQTSDTFSPLYPSVNADMINWGAGNTGDRRSQVRFTYKPSLGESAKLNLQFALAQQSAIDNQNLDGDSILDGEEATRPQIQARLGVSLPFLTSDGDINIGGWFANGEEEADLISGGTSNYDVEIYGADFTIPLIDSRLWVKGEVWTGKNGDDLRMGIGQGFRADGEDFDATGGWVELGYKPMESSRFVLGYSVDNPDDDDAAATSGRAKNTLYYIGAQFSQYEPFVFGGEYINWATEHVGLADGTDDRVKLYFSYNF